MTEWGDLPVGSVVRWHGTDSWERWFLVISQGSRVVGLLWWHVYDGKVVCDISRDGAYKDQSLGNDQSVVYWP